MVRHKFSKKYTSGIVAHDVRGHNAVGRVARCHQEWALSRNAKGHGVKSLSPWPAALGA
jgi:hypothetical protein